MTDKQRQKIKDKIEKVKKTLAAEKRKFGGFDDSRGLRYLPIELYVQLRDFDGGLKYLKWFNKNFPDDIGFPEFLFGATIIYYKTGSLIDAESMALRTYFSNTFLLDKFFIKEFKTRAKKLAQIISKLTT
jgi:hypothetical protein